MHACHIVPNIEIDPDLVVKCNRMWWLPDEDYYKQTQSATYSSTPGTTYRSNYGVVGARGSQKLYLPIAALVNTQDNL